MGGVGVGLGGGQEGDVQGRGAGGGRGGVFEGEEGEFVGEAAAVADGGATGADDPRLADAGDQLLRRGLQRVERREKRLPGRIVGIDGDGDGVRDARRCG